MRSDDGQFQLPALCTQLRERRLDRQRQQQEGCLCRHTARHDLAQHGAHEQGPTWFARIGGIQMGICTLRDTHDGVTFTRLRRCYAAQEKSEDLCQRNFDFVFFFLAAGVSRVFVVSAAFNVQLGV